MTFRKFFALIGASLLIAVGVNGFLVPHELLDGGMIGIGLILKFAYGIKAGLAILLLSLPIYGYAILRHRQLFFNSIHGLVLTSFLIDAMEPLSQEVFVPSLLSAVLGGLLVGTGTGIMLRYETSTGGLDLLALFLSRRTTINVGILIFLFDLGVLLTGHFFIGIPLTYSILVVISVGCMTSLVTFEPFMHSFSFRSK